MGTPWGPPGTPWGPLGDHLGALGNPWGTPWTPIGDPWGPLGDPLGTLEDPLAIPRGPQGVPNRSPRGPQEVPKRSPRAILGRLCVFENRFWISRGRFLDLLGTISRKALPKGPPYRAPLWGPPFCEPCGPLARRRGRSPLNPPRCLQPCCVLNLLRSLFASLTLVKVSETFEKCL